MRRRLGLVFLSVSLLAGCGGTEAEPSPESLARQQAPLTGTDVDVAPECQGILTFVNTASFETLDAYLPSDAAANLVARRATSPFVSLADVSSVSLVGPGRLQQLEGGARAQGLVGPGCVGVQDELALSVDDEAALVELVNSVSSTELHDILPYAWNGAANLLNLRPFGSAAGISGTWGVGPVSLRNLRNAATLTRPFEALVDAVNATPLPARHRSNMARHFDWYQLVTDEQILYRVYYMQCFGIDPALLPEGTLIRPNLAGAAEVYDSVDNAVSYANREGHIPASVVTNGMANLGARIAGRSFKGCYIRHSEWRYWGSNDIAFFVDTESGFSVLSEIVWTE